MIRPSPDPRGFSLVEVTIALGIAVFCLVVIFGLMTVGVNTSSASIEQTAATNILPAITSDLRAAQPKQNPYLKGQPATSKVYSIDIPPASTSASPTPVPTPAPIYLDASGAIATSTSPARYKLSVMMTPGSGRKATSAQVILSWPPNASLSNAAGTVETVVALDRN